MDKNSFFFWKIVDGKLPPPPCAKGRSATEFIQIDGRARHRRSQIRSEGRSS